jgi:tetratricopeptide (TPR) repeat protein
MLRQKFAIAIMVIGLGTGIIPVFAQDQVEPTTSGESQGDMVSIVIGGDLLERAGAAFDSGDYEKAAQDYSLFILLNPSFSQGYYLRGLTYSRLNDVDHALADMSMALDLPQPSEATKGAILNARAVLYLVQDDLEAALDDLDASIAAAPEAPDAYAQRARVFLLNQRYEEAIQDYDKVLELAPNYSQGYAGRALAHISLEHVDEALADYDKLIDLEPENPGAYLNRALIYANTSDYEAALADTNRAIELLPDDASLYLQRAAVYQALDKTVESAKDYLEWITRQQTRHADGPIFPGESQVLPMASGIRYNLSFDAAAGQHITLSAQAREAAGTDLLIVLLDNAGQPVAGDDDSGGDFDALIEDYVIPAMAPTHWLSAMPVATLMVRFGYCWR